MYFTGHSHPEISYVVYCATHYIVFPRCSHELALKRIGRYLKMTRYCKRIKADCYSDADFTGM